MKWVKLWTKIGKQPLRITQHNDVLVFVNGEEHYVKRIIYKSGIPVGLDAVKICCGTCEFCDTEVPHTCDICSSLDQEEEFGLWSLKKS